MGALAVIQELGLEQISDDGAIKEMVASVISANPDKVSEFKAGKTQLLGFL